MTAQATKDRIDFQALQKARFSVRLLDTIAREAIEGLPAHMKSGAYYYITQGQPPGGFHSAILDGDFDLARALADPTNKAALDAGVWHQYRDRVPLRALGKKSFRDGWSRERRSDAEILRNAGETIPQFRGDQ